MKPDSIFIFEVPLLLCAFSGGTRHPPGYRPCTTYSLRQKFHFAKALGAISPLCSPASKNFQKFCAVSTPYFFLSMTFLENIIK
ncbi:hypothetical protein FAEPRAA2165_01354 [Faecalibacterium duncaniae]|uniref:Uncharacterized protein n=1 Tax=Faecalibacterium duncaniae (strain DSM 17677 / JCM 31915 / A2-165) TaxID=411483 RepID=C7H4Y4_FAED2|nr:hypothetical protein FAEPRAA2165_01354 [Faecalibacterium duncaniae]